MRPNGAAEALLHDPILGGWWREREADAIDAAVSARPDEDDKRRHAMMRVQVIREMRADLRLYAEGKATAPAAG